MKIMVKVIAFVLCAVILTVFAYADTSSTILQPPNIYVWDPARPALVADMNYAESTFLTTTGDYSLYGDYSYMSETIIYDYQSVEWYYSSYIMPSSTSFLSGSLKFNQNLIFAEKDVFLTFNYVSLVWAVRINSNDSTITLKGNNDIRSAFSCYVNNNVDSDQIVLDMQTSVLGVAKDQVGDDSIAIIRTTFESPIPFYNFRHMDSADFVNMTLSFERFSASGITSVDVGILEGYIGVSPTYAYAWGDNDINWNAILDGMPDVDFIYRPNTSDFDASAFGEHLNSLDIIALILVPLIISYCGFRIIKLALHKK